MTTDHERVKAANEWNCMQIGFLIDYMESTIRSLESFEALGKEAREMIDSQITALESLKSDFRMEE